ncbi:hypothetical protein FCJ61_31840 [Burkholderia metallica]|uniref:hypothetical protein n=1 Tax=Burkholderia metallica TaxID=488729 RepID=UPI00157A6716|nr:hypothetical protein [Burkholderia metallica]NTZ87457.1 hypothetical protein [Burkholderia metallica]
MRRSSIELKSIEAMVFPIESRFVQGFDIDLIDIQIFEEVLVIVARGGRHESFAEVGTDRFHRAREGTRPVTIHIRTTLSVGRIADGAGKVSGMA